MQGDNEGWCRTESSATTPRNRRGGGDALKLEFTCLGETAVPRRESLWQEVMHLGWDCWSINAKPGWPLASGTAQHSFRWGACGHPCPGCLHRDAGSSRMMSAKLGEERSCGSGNMSVTSVCLERGLQVFLQVSAAFPFFAVKNDIVMMIAALCSLKSKLSATEESADVLLRFLKNEKYRR